MKIEWARVTWYSKLLALILFVLFPLTGFYLGMWYQKAISPPKQIQTDTIPDKDKPNETNVVQNRNKSCNKPTIIIVKLYFSKEKADKYFQMNGLSFQEAPEAPLDVSRIGSLVVDVGVGNDTYWINKIREDGVGIAVYDTVGCDF